MNNIYPEKILDVNDFKSCYKSISENKLLKLIKKGWFPIYTDSCIADNCAYLVGKIMGDGNLDSLYTLRFISGNKHELEEILNLIKNVFNVSREKMKIKGKVAKGLSFMLQVNCAPLGRLLYLLGAPVGNKTKTKFIVPKWIFKEKILKKRFLQALLEDELTTIKIEKKNYSIKPRLKLAKIEKLLSNLKQFLLQVKGMIESFEVKCTEIKGPVKTHGSNTYELYFWIQRNKRNIIKFREEIGFRANKEKQKQLEVCVEILKNTLRPEIDNSKVLNLRKKGLSIRKIANEMNIGVSTVHRIIQKNSV